MQVAETYITEFSKVIDRTNLFKMNGKVTDIVGLVIVSVGPQASLGEICTIVDKSGKEVSKAEVVGFKEGKVLSIALGSIENISPSCEIVGTGKSFRIGIGDELLGRVIDGLGNPLDDKGDILTTTMSIRELTRNGNMFSDYDYIEIEDKKSKDLFPLWSSNE